MNKTRAKKTAEPRWKQRGGGARRKGRSEGHGGPGRVIIPVLILAGALWYGVPRLTKLVLSNPVFTVENVVVEGAHYFDEDELLKTAAIERGGNLFGFDLDSVSSVLKQAYDSEDFIVFRRVPNTVVIRIQERTPVALLSGETIIGIDAEGVPLPHIDASYVETLPMVSGIGPDESLADGATRERLVSGLELLDSIARTAPEVYKQVSEVNVANLSSMGITLLGSGVEVIIGQDDWKAKLPRLGKVISGVAGRMDSIRTVDVRFGDKIFVR